MAGIAALGPRASAAWQAWTNMALGPWVITAPRALPIFGHRGATWNHVGIGIGIVTLTAPRLSLLSRTR